MRNTGYYYTMWLIGSSFMKWRMQYGSGGHWVRAVSKYRESENPVHVDIEAVVNRSDPWSDGSTHDDRSTVTGKVSEGIKTCSDGSIWCWLQHIRHGMIM